MSAPARAYVVLFSALDTGEITIRPAPDGREHHLSDRDAQRDVLNAVMDAIDAAAPGDTRHWMPTFTQALRSGNTWGAWQVAQTSTFDPLRQEHLPAYASLLGGSLHVVTFRGVRLRTTPPGDAS